MDDVSFVRDFAVTAAVFGLAGFMWFGWGQEAPPQRWRVVLGIGAVLSALVAALGVVLAWQHWGPESALATSDARRTFGIICGIEFGSAGLGAAVLGFSGRAKWISTWIAFVVGVHFIPLAYIFNDAGLFGLAALMVIAAGAGVVVHRQAGITPSAVVGLGSGIALLIYAARAALLVLTF